MTALISRSKVRLERGAPDSLFVSKLTKESVSEVEKEIETVRENTEFRSLIEQTLVSGGRTNYIQICAPFELYALTRLCVPKHIVEVGVSSGVSSAYFLQALYENGRGLLHSIDLPKREAERKSSRPLRGASWALPTGKESGWAVPSYLRRDWDLRLGKSGDVLPPLIKQLPRVDLFLYDVPYEIDEAIDDFRTVDQKLRKGSIALADNCLVPITWWAKRRKTQIHRRKGSGLRGFGVT